MDPQITLCQWAAARRYVSLTLNSRDLWALAFSLIPATCFHHFPDWATSSPCLGPENPPLEIEERFYHNRDNGATYMLDLALKLALPATKSNIREIRVAGQDLFGVATWSSSFLRVASFFFFTTEKLTIRTVLSCVESFPT
ncbi:hypothetical protein RRG08_052586 [Elysia crispata]|uniref:Uncharacterized protein n=1 Tax=Elysia crispata TaxID=231223 RepID=A0AAE1A0Y4_9GAST|nr:hypothetical protein RRG08_052586 [Elysia crispata]